MTSVYSSIFLFSVFHFRIFYVLESHNNINYSGFVQYFQEVCFTLTKNRMYIVYVYCFIFIYHSSVCFYGIALSMCLSSIDRAK